MPQASTKHPRDLAAANHRHDRIIVSVPARYTLTNRFDSSGKRPLRCVDQCACLAGQQQGVGRPRRARQHESAAGGKGGDGHLGRDKSKAPRRGHGGAF